MKPRYRSQLGTWQKVTLADDESAVSPEARTRRTKSNRPVKARVLTTGKLASTESLLTKMQELEEDGRLHTIANQEIAVRDGSEALLRTIRDEWFLVPATQPDDDHGIVCGSGFPVGLALSIAAHVGDGNDIAIAAAFEVSNRSATQHAKGPSSEVLTQRTETHAITLKSGGTMAWAGLVQCNPKYEQRSGLGRLPLFGGLFRSHRAAKRTKETVILVTAYLIPEPPSIAAPAQE
jgi:Flp pilus assembly secretin CpaC